MSNLLSDTLKEKIKYADEYINNFLPAQENSVYEAMNYSLKAGGKRIRPLLTILCCEAMGGDARDVMPLAAAVEMVHTYSLIHDDLPAMDNDDLRRGKPTSHKVFGEAAAILAGDALLTEAFSAICTAELDGEKKAAAVEKLALCAGAQGMVLGQALDMACPQSLEDVLLMYEKKTSCLLCAACSMGAIAAGGRGNEFDEFAKLLGLAFQIKDDILDVTADEAKLGKPIGSDEKNDKSTSLRFMTVQQAQDEVERLTQHALQSVAFAGDKASDLINLAQFLIVRNK